MTKKHDAVFDDILGDLDAPSPTPERAGSRFLKRSTTIADRMAGDLEEKTLRWVDPADCCMWQRHNRDYALLNEDNCRDLIDGIRAQGRQEFPAIVRRSADPQYDFEVICGARRHFAVSWLRANNYPQFKYLVELRDISDEEAFRLADIENRDREDISDYERAIDYAEAIELYYGGKQKAMAERLEVSQPWLSRYLALAKLPEEIVRAMPSIRDLRERQARELKPALADPDKAQKLLDAARQIAQEQDRARAGLGAFVDPAVVMARLRQATADPRPPRPDTGKVYKRSIHDRGIRVQSKGKKVVIEFEANLSDDALRGAFEAYLKRRGQG